jgi:hypothetical protein
MSSAFGDRGNNVRSDQFGVRRQKNKVREIKKSEFGTEEREVAEAKESSINFLRSQEGLSENALQLLIFLTGKSLLVTK